jgi:hypothetical protein
MEANLIEKIHQELPRFFSNDELNFERDLAATVSFGFFHKRALSSSDRQLPSSGPLLRIPSTLPS